MSGLVFDFDGWLSGEGISTPEMRETMASLSIRVNEEPVTKVLDGHSRSVRDSIYISLYPMAEWLAVNWFPLLFECRHPNRTDYDSRHLLTSGRAGFAAPALRFVPEGDLIRLEWHSAPVPHSDIRFLSDGNAWLPRAEVAEGLSEFISKVALRVQASGLDHRTRLEDEWDRLQSIDADERAFAEAAGALGLDPFSTSEEEDASIIEIAGQLPSALHDEFFHAASYPLMPEHLAWVQDAMNTLDSGAPTRDLSEIRARFQAEASSTLPSLPFLQGYHFARLLRRELGLNGNTLDATALSQLGWDSKQIVQRASKSLVALSDTTDDNRYAKFAISGPRTDSQRFAFARALYEYLAAPAFPRLITQAETSTQKASRAFAAEFLAPAAALQERVDSRFVSSDEVENLAESFEVSSRVIENQLINHDIAAISWDE